MLAIEPHPSMDSRIATRLDLRSIGVAWGAVIAGAFVAAAFGLALIALGAGLGFASISPWANAGASAVTVGIAAAIWLLVVQAVSSGVGGYIAGRMRPKWTDLHNDEVFFRDTAHGFLVWAVAVVMTGALLTSAAAVLVGGTAKAAAVVGVGAAGIAATAATNLASNNLDPNAYFVDALFRSDRPAAESADAPTRIETGRILFAGLRDGELSTADRAYLSQVVAARTGLTAAEADARVTDVVERAKVAKAKVETAAREAADNARKAATYSSLWMFISLLVGAFCASYAAMLGGRHRDCVAC